MTRADRCTLYLQTGSRFCQRGLQIKSGRNGVCLIIGAALLFAWPTSPHLRCPPEESRWLLVGGDRRFGGRLWYGHECGPVPLYLTLLLLGLALPLAGVLALPLGALVAATFLLFRLLLAICTQRKRYTYRQCIPSPIHLWQLPAASDTPRSYRRMGQASWGRAVSAPCSARVALGGSPHTSFPACSSSAAAPSPPVRPRRRAAPPSLWAHGWRGGRGPPPPTLTPAHSQKGDSGT